ncbi:MAG: hypothetical protein COX57_00485 [Alphaproteobacteria bacterium CG_4_10_14_0_2_um_filter_63_37]|nr:MAG: hypothetical protein AUJ55_05595 [Proteobacteria bacterium CG1_02_64_396]PJA26024.1 MAG: hypothetical protein COX57_00485 [Alphaproteobacteria bacterium CG_4_10_14_0_2_um_filter_63_37]
MTRQRTVHPHHLPPYLSLLILALALALFGLRYWVTVEAIALDAPTHVTVTPSGNLAVVVGHTLFVGDEAGVRATYDLSDFGAPFVLGDVAFYPNGDLLIQQGIAPRSFHDVLRTFDRSTGPMDGEMGPLVRCVLDTHICRPVAPNLRRPVALAIDPETEALYIADPGGGALTKRDRDGMRITERDEWSYVQQVVWDDGRLLILPYFDAAILSVDPGFDFFGRTLEKTPLLGLDHERLYPHALARVGSTWWVINERDDPLGGGLIRVDDSGKAIADVPLPEGSMALDLTAWRDRVIVADIGLRRVLRFSLDGYPLDDLAWPELTARLAPQQARQGQYKTVADVALWGLMLMFGGLGVAAWRQQRKKGDGATAEIAKPEAPSPRQTVVAAWHLGAQIFFGLSLFLGLLAAISWGFKGTVGAWGFLAGIAVLVYLAVLLLPRHAHFLDWRVEQHLKAQAQARLPAPLADPAVQWIAPSNRLVIILGVVIALTNLLPWLPFWFKEMGHPLSHEATWTWMVLSIPFLVASIGLENLRFHQLGMYDDRMWLNQNGSIVSAPIEQAISNRTFLVVQGSTTPLSLYPRRDIERLVLPLLHRAKPESTRDIGKRWLRKHPALVWGFWLWLVVLGLVVTFV